MEKCGNCKYWKRPNPPKKETKELVEVTTQMRVILEGRCQRWPPNGCGTLMPAKKMNSISQPGQQQMHLQTLEYTVWPRTKETDRCGEYHE